MIGIHCVSGIRAPGMGVWGSALSRGQSKAWPASSPSLSHIQVCFLGCALLQSVRLINQRHVRSLPLDRKSVDIWYINIQTNTCNHSSKTGECRKLLKENEMPYHSDLGKRMVCECNLKLFCFASLPPSLFMVAQEGQTFGVRFKVFVTHRNRLNMANQIWFWRKSLF